jgi:hypothetical protein
MKTAVPALLFALSTQGTLCLPEAKLSGTRDAP